MPSTIIHKRVTPRILPPPRHFQLRNATAGCALLLTLALCGCHPRFYAARGTVQSEGGPLGHWSLRPDGCSLAPFDGLPADRSSSVVEFIWQHGRPSLWTSKGVENRWIQAPWMLDISRAPDSSGAADTSDASARITASLKLERTVDPVPLNASVCKELRLDRHPGPPVVPGGPPSLAGHLLMDCTVQGSHVTADVVFRGCVL